MEASVSTMDCLSGSSLNGPMTTITNSFDSLPSTTAYGDAAAYGDRAAAVAPPSVLAGYTRSATLTAAAGAGVAGGVLFAFSTFIMPALRSLPAEQGLAAMQAINKFAPTPVFMAVLMGTAALCVPLAISALPHLDEQASRRRLAGSALYLATILITGAYHVPHNNALALISPTSAGAASAWHHYASSWTLWNHVRAATAIAGSFVLMRSTVASGNRSKSRRG
jgi:uncharacterized membrane protein